MNADLTETRSLLTVGKHAHRGGASRVSQSRLRRFFLIQLLFLVLLVAHRTFMLGVWGNDFLEKNWITRPQTGYALAWAIGILSILAVIATARTTRLSDLLLLLQLAIPIIPMLVLFSHRAAPLEYVLDVAAAYILLVLTVRMPKLNFVALLPTRSRVRRGKIRRLLLFLLVLVVLFIVGSIVSGGLDTFNLNPLRAYEFRRETPTAQISLLSYLLTNLVAIGIPCAMAIAAARRNYGLLTLLIASSILIAGLTSQKSHFFLPLIVLSVYFVLGRKQPVDVLLLSLIGITAVVILLFFIMRPFDIFGTWTVRRGFFVPAYTNFLYYDFFGERGADFVRWSDSGISLGLFSDPYDLPIPRVIANVYSGRAPSHRALDFSNANSGWLGAGYAHFGLMGMLVYAVVLGGFMRVADRLAEVIGIRAAGAAVVVVFVTAFTSSDLTTSALSHGLIGMTVITLILRSTSAPSRKLQ